MASSRSTGWIRVLFKRIRSTKGPGRGGRRAALSPPRCGVFATLGCGRGRVLGTGGLPGSHEVRFGEADLPRRTSLIILRNLRGVGSFGAAASGAPQAPRVRRPSSSPRQRHGLCLFEKTGSGPRRRPSERTAGPAAGVGTVGRRSAGSPAPGDMDGVERAWTRRLHKFATAKVTRGPAGPVPHRPLEGELDGEEGPERPQP
jgi:hypothetical protein